MITALYKSVTRVICAIVATQLLPSVCFSQEPVLLPVPKSGPQHIAEGKIRQKYKDLYAVKDPGDREILARQLRSDAIQLKRSNLDAYDDPAMRFVLLREARELAVDAGNLHLAIRCIDEIAGGFAIDATDMKLTALAGAMDKADLSPGLLAESYFQVIDDFLEIGDVDSAMRTMVLVRSCQRRAPRDEPLKEKRNQYEQKLAAARKALNEVATASRKLQKDPDNASLDQTVGVYLFNAGNWKEGIALLAKGEDPALRDLCKRDLANPTDPAAMADLADAWWAFGDGKVIHISAARRRSAHWYQRALPRIDSFKKVNVQNRLGQLDEENGK